jgi:hypothetical protein
MYTFFCQPFFGAKIGDLVLGRPVSRSDVFECMKTCKLSSAPIVDQTDTQTTSNPESARCRTLRSRRCAYSPD